MREESSTPVTFSREEMAEIREMLNTLDSTPICPRCREALMIEELVDRGNPLAGSLYMKCLTCRRSAFIRQNP